MTPEERIARLEHVLGTLIGFLCYVSLNVEATKQLLDLLVEGDEPKKPPEAA